MYLVTVEDETGMWFDDPQGFDTRAEAQAHFNALRVKGAAAFAIYECHQVCSRNAADLAPLTKEQAEDLTRRAT